MRILHLTLKAKFYDMIASGDKLEEYREIKPFWIKRLISDEFNWDCQTSDKRNYHFIACPKGFYKEFDVVNFARGGHFHPSLPQMTVECKGISRGEGKPEWGAEPGKEYFVIKLGEIIPPTQNQ
jgi:hypothetical protein